MKKDKEKVFKDSVHGYIEIPSVIVSNIIDTEQFQRLRYIEQTSMRSLYPAARHDRFIHSLGVYYLGKLAFKGFKDNSQKVIESLSDKIPDEILKKLDGVWWDKQELLFEIACLMHDCAHAPFSHTLEQYYHLKKEDDGTPKLIGLLIEECEKLGDKSFKDDLYNEKDMEWIGKPHEQLSSFIILSEYKEAINKVFECLLPDASTIEDEDYVFICRMITGCKYNTVNEEDIIKSLKNCIISLLNSSSIDVDGLDYIVRDAQMSGISAYNIDYQRILNSFTILPVKSYKNETLKDKSINGIWLKNSFFNVKIFKGDIIGELEAKGEGVKEKVTSSKGEDLKSLDEDCVVSTNSNAWVKFDSIRLANVELRSASKVSPTNFEGTVTGQKILLPEDKIESISSFELGYDKRCLSILQNTIDARNNEYIWIYTHPKVLYNSNYIQCRLLEVSADYLKDLIYDEMKGIGITVRSLDCITQILGYEELFDNKDKKICDQLKKYHYYFKRSNDDDINSLFKRIYLEIKDEGKASPSVNEFVQLYEDYFGRKQRRLIWKSFMEKTVFIDSCKANKCDFEGINIFLNKVKKSLKGQEKLYKLANGDIKSIFESHGFGDVLVVCSKAKTKEIDYAEFFVRYGERSERLYDIFDSNMKNNGMDKPVDYIFYKGEPLIDFSRIEKLNDELSAHYNDQFDAKCLQ